MREHLPSIPGPAAACVAVDKALLFSGAPHALLYGNVNANASETADKTIQGNASRNTFSTAKYFTELK